MPHTQQQNQHTLSAEQVCGYCIKVQKSHGGNKGYKCKRHMPRVTISTKYLYTQEHVDKLVAQAVSEEQNRSKKLIELFFALDYFWAETGFKEDVGWQHRGDLIEKVRKISLSLTPPSPERKE